MMVLLTALVVIAVALLVVAALGTLRPSPMTPAVPDRPALHLPPGGVVTGGDVRDVMLSQAVRGYRMDDVDRLLDRVADELDVRDERIAALEARLTPGSAHGVVRGGEVREGSGAGRVDGLHGLGPSVPDLPVDHRGR